MNPRLSGAIAEEMRAGHACRAAGDLQAAFRHFERAHVLGQCHTMAHVRAHLAMLGIGWTRRDLREVVGQIPRIFAALAFSRIWVPIGNTGGADVSAFQPMAIPADLAELLNDKN